MAVSFVVVLLGLLCSLQVGKTTDIVNAQNNDGNTPLHIGVEKGHMEISDFLIKMGGANVDIQNNKLQAPLHLAVNLRHIKIMKLLVRQRASMSLQDENGNSPLHLALLNYVENSPENENEVQQNHCGDQFDEDSKDGSSFAYISCFLVTHGANLNLENNDGLTPLDLCNKLKSCDKTNAIYRNWDIDTSDNNGNTALHICAQLNRTEIAELLIEHGANMDLRNFKIQTALHIAVDLAHIKIMEMLVSNGCNLTLGDEDGNTPLHIAVNHNLEEMENSPRKNNLCDRQAETPVDNLKGYPYIACYLVRHGSNWSIKNNNSKSPIQLCPGLRKCVVEEEK